MERGSRPTNKKSEMALGRTYVEKRRVKRTKRKRGMKPSGTWSCRMWQKVSGRSQSNIVKSYEKMANYNELY